MKALFFILILITSPAFAKVAWLQKLERAIEERGVEIKNKGDLMRFLEGEDYQEKDLKHEMLPESLVDEFSDHDYARDLTSVIESKDGRKIQINIFKKAYFYKNTAATGLRQPSNTPFTSTQVSQREDAFEFRSQFFYSRLSATDTRNGGSANTSSDINLGVVSNYKRPVNDQMQLRFGFSGAYMAFQAPEGTNLAESDGIYFSGTGGLEWDIDESFTLSGYMGLKQLPYLTAFGAQLEIDAAMHPIFGAGIRFNMEKLLGIDLRPELVSEWLNNSIDGGVQASTGVMLGTKLNYYFFKQKSYKPMVSLWFNTYSQSTNNTSQDVNEIGLWYGFQLDL